MTPEKVARLLEGFKRSRVAYVAGVRERTRIVRAAMPWLLPDEVDEPTVVVADTPEVARG